MNATLTVNGEKMKKLTALMTCLLMFFSMQCLTPSVFGATVGANSDISSPEGWLDIPKVGKSPLKASYIYEYERRLLRPSTGGPRAQVNWNLAKLAIALGGRVEPYVELGSAQVLIEEPVNRGFGLDTDAFQFERSFAWGIGTKVLLWQQQIFRNQKKLQFFTDVKYRRTRANNDTVTGQKISLGSDTLTFNEWQAAIGVSQEFRISKHLSVTPYFGGKYSDVEMVSKGSFALQDNGGLAGKTHYQSHKKFGPFVGVDMGIGKCVTVFAEGRFVDEYGVSAGATVRF